MNAPDSIKKLALSFIPKAGPSVIRKLVAYNGGVDSVFNNSLNQLTSVNGVGTVIAKNVISNRKDALERAKLEYEYLINNEIDCITYFDNTYPLRLKQCEDAPLSLYYKGIPDFNAPKVLAVVGTRKPTRESLEICKQIIAQLAQRHTNLVIVSGLAYGMDACAHKAALDNNLPTWAVLGHGMETIYPKANVSLAQSILKSGGAIITEFAHKSKIDPSNFVKRNRIIAGLSDAILVVDSGRKGGSVITADLGNQYNRDVFAVPSSINRLGGNGCNLLIKSHRANLTESAKDIEYITGWSPKESDKHDSQHTIILPSDLSNNEQLVVDVLKNEKYVDMDSIVQKTKLDNSIASLTLLELEFKGVIRSLPGKIFSISKG